MIIIVQQTGSGFLGRGDAANSAHGDMVTELSAESNILMDRNRERAIKQQQVLSLWGLIG